MLKRKQEIEFCERKEKAGKELRNKRKLGKGRQFGRKKGERCQSMERNLVKWR